MKRFLLSSVVAFCCMALSATNFTEDFNTGLPSSASAVESEVNLPSGTWKVKNVYGYTGNGATSARMTASGASLTTPYINKPSSISFTHKASGSYKDLILQKSIDKGLHWTDIQTFKSASGSFASASAMIREDSRDSVLIRFYCGAATIYIDDVSIVYSTMAEEPKRQASMQVLEVTGSSVRLAMQKGDGDGRLLICQQDSASAWTPVDGIAYSGNFPKTLTSSVYAIAGNDEDTVTALRLAAGKEYYFTVFEYKGSGADRNYLLPGNTCHRQTLTVPTIHLNKTSLDFKNTLVGKSKEAVFSFSADYLQPDSGQMTIRASHPAFAFALSSQGDYADTLCVDYTQAQVKPLTVYVRFKPMEYAFYSDTVFLQGGQAVNSLILTGTGSDTESLTYYISPLGNDEEGDGSLEKPWYNLQKAVDAALPGDEIICRGGEYFPNMMKDGSKTTVRITTSGTADRMISIRNADGEIPVMNFKEQQPKLEGIRGLLLTGNYWHIYGIHFTRAGDNAIKLEGSHNIIERCTFSYNFDTGLQLGFGHDFSASGHGSSNDGSWCSYNDIIDCDSYRNCDYDTNYGSDADGFACKMHNGKGNRFIRCRAWENSDDAWDLYETDYPVILIECWAWRSGRAEDAAWVRDVVPVSHGFSGNGNGIKMGGNGTGGSSKGKHEAWNCIAFNCNKSGSVKGFDQNSHSGGEKLVNCLAFGCGYDFMFERASSNSEYYNNVCLGRQEIAGGKESNNAIATATDKGWSNRLVTGVSASDYISLSEEDAKAPRGEDGCMPERFARLKSGSKLVDAGLWYNIPYTDEFPFLFQAVYGLGRDMGPYELQEGEITSSSQVILNPDAVNSLRIVHRAYDHQALSHFATTTGGEVALSVFDLNGRFLFEAFRLQTVAGAEYDMPFDVSLLPAGVYFCRLDGMAGKHSAYLLVR